MSDGHDSWSWRNHETVHWFVTFTPTFPKSLVFTRNQLLTLIGNDGDFFQSSDEFEKIWVRIREVPIVIRQIDEDRPWHLDSGVTVIVSREIRDPPPARAHSGTDNHCQFQLARRAIRKSRDFRFLGQLPRRRVDSDWLRSDSWLYAPFEVNNWA